MIMTVMMMMMMMLMMEIVTSRFFYISVVFTSLSIGKLRRFTVLEIVVRSISPLDALYLVLVRSLCELSLGLELYLVLSIVSIIAQQLTG
jgi:hypothetical protein